MTRPVPTGAGSVTGWLQPPEGNGSFDDDPSDDVVPQLRTADASSASTTTSTARTSSPPRRAPGLRAGDLDSLPEVGRFTALRNLLYAFEWWFFGAFAAFIWWRWVRDEQAARTAGAEADAASVD